MTRKPLSSEDRQLRARVERWLAVPRPDLPLPPNPNDPVLTEGIREVGWAIQATDIGPSVFWANSVWQCELELWKLVGRTRTILAETEIEPGLVLGPLGQSSMRPLFRGERFDRANPDFRPLTSTARRNGMPSTLVTQLNQAFARIVDTVIEPRERYGVEVSELSWWAVARHYGMPSNLLDLTADPSVAAHFADRSDSPFAVVYWLPARWCVEKGLRVLFPPPSCDRLYLQRGILLDTTGLTDRELSDAAFSIVFPTSGHHRVIRPAPPNGAADLYWSAHPGQEIDVTADRRKGSVFDRLPSNNRRREHWFRRVVVWVEKHIDEVQLSSPAADAGLVKQALRAVGPPTFLEDTSWHNYARALNSLLIWVAGYEISAGKFALDSDIRTQLERDNSFLRTIDNLPWMARPKDGL